MICKALSFGTRFFLALPIKIVFRVLDWKKRRKDNERRFR